MQNPYRRAENKSFIKAFYVILQKSYLKEKSTKKAILAIQYLRKLISLLYKNNSNKSIATLL